MRISRGGAALVPILRDATLLVAPQDEVCRLRQFQLDGNDSKMVRFNPWSIALAKMDDEAGLRRECHRLETLPLGPLLFVRLFYSARRRDQSACPERSRREATDRVEVMMASAPE